jgi:hypothetical protein
MQGHLRFASAKDQTVSELVELSAASEHHRQLMYAVVDTLQSTIEHNKARSP